jgi:hypothetical protein
VEEELRNSVLECDVAEMQKLAERRANLFKSIVARTQAAWSSKRRMYENRMNDRRLKHEVFLALSTCQFCNSYARAIQQ